jgi:prepilin-type N-terminal cleavage/methylation domain-containing protein
MMSSKRNSSRGFTLVEMLTSVAIVGLILVLIGYEFDASLSNLIHTRSNRDMEANARIVMSKVTNRLRTASPWVFNPGTPSGGVDQVIVLPVPTASPTASNVLQFYRVRPGTLANPGPIPTPLGVPNPPYDLVTIQRATCPTTGCLDPSPNYLVETAVDSLTLTQSEEPIVLGKDVTNFSVLAPGNPNATEVDISLTVLSPSSQRCDPKCSYTTNSSIWVGGDQVENQ